MTGISSSVARASQEYISMPQRKLRAASYIRESDPRLQLDSTTMESQAKAVRTYIEQQGYSFEPEHEFREAISGYEVAYINRRELQKLLKVVERQQVDVVVLNEVRALSRKEVEVLIVYELLQKHGVAMETPKDKFSDDAMGRIVLALQAGFSELDREKIYYRLQRGKADRVMIGNAPNGHPFPSYGYMWVDTEKEVKGQYDFNHEIVYVDRDGREWSRYHVALFIFEELKQQGASLHGTAVKLNEIGVPPPRQPKKREPHWTASQVRRIVENPIYIGEVWANRYYREEKKNKGADEKKLLKKRPKEEWILLPEGTAPALIDKETRDAVLKQISTNRQESIRNNKHPDELGLLRAGYIFCGICGGRMNVKYPSEAELRNGASSRYKCQKKDGGEGIEHNHRVQIHTKLIDNLAKEKIAEALQHPELVRAKVEELRNAIKKKVDTTAIEETLANIKRKIKNLQDLAEDVSDKEEMANLKVRIKELSKHKQDAESLLYDIADEDEERAKTETELQRFEKWAKEVQPDLTDPAYIKNAPYEELRMAIAILGLKATIYPTEGDYPFRYHIDVTVPEVMQRFNEEKAILLQSSYRW